MATRFATEGQAKFIANLNREGIDLTIAQIERDTDWNDPDNKAKTIELLRQSREQVLEQAKLVPFNKVNERLDFLKSTLAVLRKQVPQAAPSATVAAPTATPGFYMLGEDVFKVVATKDGQRVYAKQLVIDKAADTMTWGYAQGAVRQLTEDKRLTVEQAVEFTRLTNRCAICGKKIKKTVSVERGIGPKCWANAGF